MTTSSTEQGVRYRTRIATASLATATNRDCLMKKGTNDGEIAISAAVADIIIGVLKNLPAAGEQALLACDGDVLCRCSADIAESAAVGSAGNGKAVTVTEGTDVTVHIIGRCVGASSADNDLALVQLALGAQPLAVKSA